MVRMWVSEITCKNAFFGMLQNIFTFPSMTYTLFECLKERITDLLNEQPDEVPSDSTIVNVIETIKLDDTAVTTNVKVKKEHLTKSQKRRQWEHSDHKGEKPRGYNWVDIVKHLSQTGGKDESGSLPQNYEG